MGGSKERNTYETVEQKNFHKKSIGTRFKTIIFRVCLVGFSGFG